MQLKRSVFILVTNIHLILGSCDLRLSPDDYGDLPKLYDFENPDACPEGNFYCKVYVKLRPHNDYKSRQIWEKIERTVNQSHIYIRRDTVYRGICILGNDTENIHYQCNDLVSQVEEKFCYPKTNPFRKVSSDDAILITIILFYVALIIYCTVATQFFPVNKYLEPFSVTQIWKNLNKKNRNENFNDLQSMQGMRTLAMASIVASHNYMAKIFLFSKNPEFLEEFSINPVKQLFPNLIGNLVQIFFIISSWLLATQLHNVYKRNGTLTFRNVCAIALNRYFRLIVLMVAVIIIHRSVALIVISSPLYYSVTESETNRCKIGWWRNLLFIQNIGQYAGEICSPGTWYIAADTQMYIIFLLMFYVSKKLNISMKYLVWLVVSTCIAVQGYIVWNADYEGLMRFNKKLVPAEKAFSTPEFTFSYANTICNLATYAIGFGFGSIYSGNKGKNIFNTKINQFLWMLTFCAFPLIVTTLHSRQNSKWIEVIFAVCLRPLFSFGIAVGLFGMANKIGGQVRKFFECGPLVFLGDFTYCVYMFHFLVVFGRALSQEELTIFTTYGFYKSIATDVFESFLLGFLLHIFLERPFGQLQKLILPQITFIRRKNK